MLKRCICVLRQYSVIQNVRTAVPFAGYKSQYNIENVYPNSSLDYGTSTLNKEYVNSEEFKGYIPLEELEIAYSRSGGPGGQHVNKVNTKVEVRFHVASAKWIPDSIKPVLLEQEKSRITKGGYLIVTSEKTRKQMLNQADALQKIREMVWAANVKPYTPTEEEVKLREKRLAKAKSNILREKKKLSLKKQSRRSPTAADL